MEIRQVAAAERIEIMFPLQQYAFSPSPWTDEERERYRHRTTFHETATSLVAEEGGQAMACMGGLPMRQNVRGVVHDMAGVAAVASHPSARRQGFVRQLLWRLLHEMREQGCTVSALYPFRPSFYARFGFVGLPRVRRATFTPEGLSHLMRADLPGTVEWLSGRAGFDPYDAFSRRLLTERHGFSVFDEARTAEFRDDRAWVAIARAGGETVGAIRYRIDRFGGELIGEDMLTSGPLGRALLLQFFARHVDQVSRVVVKLGTDEVPDLWGTDMVVTTEGRVAYPSNGGPMVRILDLEAFDGTPVGAGAGTVEVIDDEMIGGGYDLVSDDGLLRVTKRKAGQPVSGARLTVAGISGLVYGVLDPVDVVTRGLGVVEPGAIEPLRSLFPQRMPYMFADF